MVLAIPARLRELEPMPGADLPGWATWQREDRPPRALHVIRFRREMERFLQHSVDDPPFPEDCESQNGKLDSRSQATLKCWFCYLTEMHFCSAVPLPIRSCWVGLSACPYYGGLRKYYTLNLGRSVNTPASYIVLTRVLRLVCSSSNSAANHLTLLLFLLLPI